MKTSLLAVVTMIVVTTLVGCTGGDKADTHLWKVHDKNRPLPEIITPGRVDSDAPSDAIVLFDGQDLSAWERDNGDEAGWKVENGYMEVVKKSGSIQTKKKFGCCQLHIEWATPEVAKGNGQGRGNSGVYLMNMYEVQVLDSYDNTTYPDGQAGSIYGQNPPKVNVCRGPGQWQSYDIIFHRPIFKDDKVVSPATVTVLQNGVLVQDNWVIEGPTAHKERVGYSAHEDKLPIQLQNHSNPTRYRNIWIRELKD